VVDANLLLELSLGRDNLGREILQIQSSRLVVSVLRTSNAVSWALVGEEAFANRFYYQNAQPRRAEIPCTQYILPICGVATTDQC